MTPLWFGIVALMFCFYIVLDGYDLGAGALHRFVARTDEERRTVIAAIGPYWDAHEVWLIAAGGTLFAAFPRALASGLSGFYLAIFLVVWCLLLRAIAIEFRSHLPQPLWRGFFDTTFALASGLLPVLFGAALGNIVRGVPLDGDGWFQLTLFTTFMPRPPAGLLDWFTVLSGVFAWLTLAGHGACFLAWRTAGTVHERSTRLAVRFYVAVAILWPLVTLATHRVNPTLLAALPSRPMAWGSLALAVAGLLTVFVALRRGRAREAFIGSCAFIAGMLAATAACLFPVILRSDGDPARSITVWNAGATAYSLHVALGWWSVGFVLAVFYVATLFRIHRGKVTTPADDHAY